MTAFLVPGQGSQKPGMGRDLYDGSSTARPVFDEAAAILGEAFLDTMFAGSEDAVRDTRVAQPALVTVGVAAARHLEHHGITPEAAAGHSVGEIAALVIAGVLTFEDALALTRERARLMSDDAPPGTMAAVMGLDPAAIEAALPEGAEIANFNGPQQTIISGSADAIQAAESALKEAGAKRVLPLNVAGPFHSSLMTKPAEGLAEVVRDISFTAPRIDFVSSVSGARETDPERMRTLLAEQVAAPVRWTDVLHTLGPVEAYEVGPGHVLQGIAKRLDGAPRIHPAGTLDAVAQAAR